MSRKPVDQQQPSECRQAIWNEFRANPDTPYTIPEMAKCVRLDQSSVRAYIIGLYNAGILGINSVRKEYFLLKNTGVAAPRVRKDGSEVTQGRSRKYMWNVMGLLKSFSASDLAYTASTAEHTVSETDAKDYIGHLAKAGYLLAGRIAPGERLFYRMKPGMWTGPNPPQVQRTKQIYDPNLQRVVWSAVTGGAE